MSSISLRHEFIHSTYFGFANVRFTCSPLAPPCAIDINIISDREKAADNIREARPSSGSSAHALLHRQLITVPQLKVQLPIAFHDISASSIAFDTACHFFLQSHQPSLCSDLYLPTPCCPSLDRYIVVQGQLRTTLIPSPQHRPWFSSTASSHFSLACWSAYLSGVLHFTLHHANTHRTSFRRPLSLTSLIRAVTMAQFHLSPRILSGAPVWPASQSKSPELASRKRGLCPPSSMTHSGTWWKSCVEILQKARLQVTLTCR